MCGIGGILYFDPERRAARGLLERMNRLQAHRGPDGAGLHLDGPLGLCHRRLRVIDLSAAGDQPMASEDGAVWIVFNGEIYNFQALRADLLGRGHRFRSRTDTEVLLHLYEEHGPACLPLLRGMFAFAVWDGRQRSLFLARDRFGVKPLYYQLDAGAIRFASEAKALLADPEVPVDPDPAILWQYLTYGVVPGPGSAFRGLARLPPAHYLLCREGRVEVVRYWRLPRARAVERPEAAWCEEIRARLEEAVRIRLASDVPLGAFLSGGIDSAAVVAMMCRAGAGRVRTFSIGFAEPEYDELPSARLVAERFGTEHHELVVRPDAAALLPRLAWQHDEPFGDSSAVPTACVAEMARRQVTVALTGDAGDEAFGGYERYAACGLAAGLDRWPGAGILRAAAAGLGRALPRAGARGGLLARSRRFLAALGDPPERRYGRWLCHVLGDAKRALCTEAFQAAAGEGDDLARLVGLWRESGDTDARAAALAVDLGLYLPDDLLVKADVATMSHALEARSPFVDHELMEFAATIPVGLKVRGFRTKHILREALSGLVPDPILARPKMGFGAPIDHWLRHELRELVEDALLSPRALGRGLVRPQAVRGLVEEHRTGRANHRDALWLLLMLELWHRAHLDADGELAQARRPDAECGVRNAG
jgi:asparagine synthase (glutamine-hydrolysing)